MKKLLSLLSSYTLMIILFILLSIGAGVATFIENDFGASSARAVVYNNIWYEVGYSGAAICAHKVDNGIRQV